MKDSDKPHHDNSNSQPPNHKGDEVPDSAVNPDVQTPLFAPDAVVQPNPTPDPGEVRAGPGDVGASDAPRALPPSNQNGQQKSAISRIVLAIAIGVPVVLLIAALF